MRHYRYWSNMVLEPKIAIPIANRDQLHVAPQVPNYKHGPQTRSHWTPGPTGRWATDENLAKLIQSILLNIHDARCQLSQEVFKELGSM